MEEETRGYSSPHGRMIINLKLNIAEVPSHHNFMKFVIAKMEGGVILSVYRDRWVRPPDHRRVTLAIENKNNLKYTSNRSVTVRERGYLLKVDA